MKQLIYGIIAVACMGTGCSTQKSMEKSGSSSEWKALLDGKTTQGWHSYGKQTTGKGWKIEPDGSLHLDASNKKDWQSEDGGDIVTNEEFGEFHLKLEWKIAKNGNSGVLFFVQEDPAKYQYVWNTGPEMQVLDNNGHPDAKIHKHRAGDLYDLIASEETVKPAGEWNKAEIINKDQKLVFKLNGKKVLETTLWDEQWKSLIAGSKFSTMPGFGTFKRGKIALQDHGDDVWFRNIQIKRFD